MKCTDCHGRIGGNSPQNLTKIRKKLNQIAVPFYKNTLRQQISPKNLPQP